MSHALSQALAAHRAGRLDEAERLYERLLARRPDDFSANYHFASLHYQRGRYPEALRCLGAALAANPREPTAWSNLGVLQAGMGQPGEALASYEKALALMPRSAAAHNNRGSALIALKQREAALASFEAALALKSDYVEALSNRGAALIELGRPAEALASLDRAIGLDAGHVEAHVNRGNALKMLSRADEALQSYERALALRPTCAAAHDGRGVTLLELGRGGEAADAFTAAIALEPGKARHFYNLTLTRRLSPSDPHWRALEGLAQAPPADLDERIHLGFARARALEAAGEAERGFRQLIEANALKRSATPYEESETLAGLARVAAALTPEALRARAGAGASSPLPIFIVGMPRSGTTLIEQILARHPDVFAAGEIDDFEQAAAARLGGGGPARMAEAAARASPEDFSRIGADYVARIRAFAPKAQRIVNKTPANFALVGLIHLALPAARIIDVRRDPLDTCLSCFSSLFVGELPWAYDLATLGRYYRGYEALMAHWRAAPPAAMMLEARYEDFVGDLKRQTRRLLAHCGLAFDARCLEFHRDGRQVRTASALQVRQPLYASSVGRWRRHAAMLGPLIAELGPPRAPQPDAASRGLAGRLAGLAAALRDRAALR
jgi:tetratricopeptide (TPR) repeat protein